MPHPEEVDLCRAARVNAFETGATTRSFDMSSIPLDLQRRFEQRWAARFASAAPKSIALNRIVNSLPPRPAKAKGKPAGVNRRVREGGPEPAPVAVTA